MFPCQYTPLPVFLLRFKLPPLFAFSISRSFSTLPSLIFPNLFSYYNTRAGAANVRLDNALQGFFSKMTEYPQERALSLFFSHISAKPLNGG